MGIFIAELEKMLDFIRRKSWLGGWILAVAGAVLCILCYELLRRYDGHASPLMLPPAGRFFRPGETGICFAVFGDFRIQTEPFEAVMKSIRGSGADFALCVGDMSRKREIQHFCWLAERMKHAAGDLAVFCTPGNNDRESRDPRENGLRAYKGVFGQSGYWFAWGDSLFISLDTSAERLAAGELERLEEILKAERDRFRRLVVFTHVPPLDLRREGRKECLPAGEVDDLEALLREYRLSLFVAGHQHAEARWEFAGAPLLVTPTSGQRGEGKDPRYGYWLVKLLSDGGISAECRRVEAGDDTDTMDYFLSSRMNQTGWLFRLGVVLLLAGCGMIGILRPPDGKSDAA